MLIFEPWVVSLIILGVAEVVLLGRGYFNKGWIDSGYPPEADSGMTSGEMDSGSGAGMTSGGSVNDSGGRNDPIESRRFHEVGSVESLRSHGAGNWVWGWVFGVVVLAVFIYLFYLTRVQFLAWAGSDLTKVLVPPFSGIGYFLLYSWTHWWQSFFIGLAMGWIFLRGAQWLNRRRGGMIFYDEEPYLLAMGVFLAGQPAWIVYFGLLFVVTVVVNLVGTVRAKVGDSGYFATAKFRNDNWADSGSEAGMTQIEAGMTHAVVGMTNGEMDSRFRGNDKGGGLPRISYYYLWLPVSAAAILLTNLVSLEWFWGMF